MSEEQGGGLLSSSAASSFGYGTLNSGVIRNERHALI